MPRIARAVAVGHPHHITQRGNYRQQVFKTGEDYLQYLQWLKEYCEKYSFKIWAYCLMSNHVHFVGVPMNDDSLSRVFSTLHMRYSQYVNQQNSASGHLWQGRFFSCVLDERHVYAAVRYVENNPVRAGIVDDPSDYKWSSAKAHVFKEQNQVLNSQCFLTERIEDWAAYLKERDDEPTKTIIQNTRRGRPCGDDSFVGIIEDITGIRLKVLPKGRPKKEKQ